MQMYSEKNLKNNVACDCMYLLNMYFTWVSISIHARLTHNAAEVNDVKFS